MTEQTNPATGVNWYPEHEIPMAGGNSTMAILCAACAMREDGPVAIPVFRSAAG